MTSEITISIMVLAGSALGSLLLYLGTRGKTKADRKTALDERIDERVQQELERVYSRLDAFEERERRRNGAFGRILRAIAAQWSDPAGPNLDPDDIAEVEDTIPVGWIRRSTRTD